MNRRLAKYLIWTSFILTVSLSFAAYLFYRYLNEPDIVRHEPVVVEVLPGTAFSGIARQLAGEGLISKPRWLTLYAVLTGQAERIQAGEYQVQPGQSPKQLLGLLVSGKVVQYQVTLVEGWRFDDFLAKLAEQEKLVKKCFGLSPQQIMAELGHADEHPEGRFFPDSYQYVAGTSDLDILRRAYQRLELVLAEEWQNRADHLPYETPYEALIMASIIEKETGLASERGEIAGVFVRRLQRGMRLQTDPSVIYGLGTNYQGNIKRKHLRQSTAYNTYVIKGLPPTPIAMVGRAAIHAALHPEPGTSLYFVARGDGSHFFSDTLEQHHRAVQQYQVEQRSQQYQSAPK